MRIKKTRRGFTEKEYTCRMCGIEQKFYLTNIVDISSYKTNEIAECIECPKCGWKWWIITKSEKKFRSPTYLRQHRQTRLKKAKETCLLNDYNVKQKNLFAGVK